MGNKYPTQAIANYNDDAPSDDGTKVESNKIKYSTVKNELADPIKTLSEAINTKLVDHFDRGPVATSATATVGAANYNEILECTGTITLTLTDAATLGTGFFCDIRNVGAGTITLGRATASDTINATTADVSIPTGKELRVFVNAAANGFYTIFSNTDSTDSAWKADNLAIAASVVSNILTISLKGKDLNDPSSTNTVNIPFVSETLTTGDYDVVSVAAATSVTVDAGATLGFTNSEDGYIYVYALNNGGTAELAVRKKALRSLSGRVSTTVLDTSADSDNVMYSDTARSNLPFRLVSVLRITTGSTAGNWDAAPTEVRPWHPGMSITGDLLQKVEDTDSALATGTTAFPNDDTIPQNTEGDEYMTASITPFSSINDLEIEVHYNGSHSADALFGVALFQDSTANALAAVQDYVSSAEQMRNTSFSHFMKTGTVSSTTFKVRAGGATGATTSFNGSSGARKLGGVAASSLSIKEYQA